MTTAADFRRGDIVLSPVHVRGTVTNVINGVVFVEYRELGRDRIERKTEGVYDADWFKRWPNMLTKVLRDHPTRPPRV